MFAKLNTQDAQLPWKETLRPPRESPETSHGAPDDPLPRELGLTTNPRSVGRPEIETCSTPKKTTAARQNRLALKTETARKDTIAHRPRFRWGKNPEKIHTHHAAKFTVGFVLRKLKYVLASPTRPPLLFETLQYSFCFVLALNRGEGQLTGSRKPWPA